MLLLETFRASFVKPFRRLIFGPTVEETHQNWFARAVLCAARPATVYNSKVCHECVSWSGFASVSDEKIDNLPRHLINRLTFAL